MGEWIKALGIDYGTVRIGLAVSDDLGFLAHPLETVSGEKLEAAVEKIAGIVEERRIEDVIIGLPLHLDGREGKAVRRVRNFEEALKEKLPAETRWHEVDERFTTAVAMDKLHAVGKNEKNSRQMIDQAAAVEILQRWLDERAEGGLSG